MKFDVVVGNPPYQGKAALHQQFFVKAFGTLNSSGTIAFIQPATMYMNKKDVRRKGPEKEMLAIVNAHGLYVGIKGEDVFVSAQIVTKLAVTIASPAYTGQIHVKYQSGKQLVVDSTDSINQLELDPEAFQSIKSKYAALCAKNGSFQDVVWETHNTKAYIAKVRGHTCGNDDFFTLVPRVKYRKSEPKFNTPSNHEFGIPLQSPDHLDNFYDYCETNFARMALALMKTTYHNESGEMVHVPLMDFSRTYPDQELYSMAGFTQEEISVIETVLPDYYNRRK